MARPRSFDIFFAIRVHQEKLGHVLKLGVPKFHFDLYLCFGDMAEKQVPAKLKPIVGSSNAARSHYAKDSALV